MCQSPSRDLTADSTCLNASLPDCGVSSFNAPRRRQFRQSPFVKRETAPHSEHIGGSSLTRDAGKLGGPRFMGYSGGGVGGGPRERVFSSTISPGSPGLAVSSRRKAPE